MEAVTSLTPKRNPQNPNRHPRQQIRLLAKIITAHGWRNAIVVSKRSGLITKGHGRLDAAELLGLEKAPVDYQDYATAAEEMSDMVADNRIAELAEMDNTALAGLLRELKKAGRDMELTGFEKDELAALLDATPDDIEKALKVKRSKIAWDHFKVFHCMVGDGIYCLDRFNYLVSYGTMEGKPPPKPKPKNSVTFIDSGMLTLARKIGAAALGKQRQVLEYADKCDGDWVTMMDIPQVPEILADLKLSKVAAHKAHMKNAREFAGFKTGRRKVFVMQGQSLREYQRCCEDMKSLVGPADVVAIGSIKGRADSPEAVAAITATVHKAFPKNDIHLFGITNPTTVTLAATYGATSGDSSTAGNALGRGELLFAKKKETHFAVVKTTFAEVIGEPISVNSKIWLAIMASNMGHVNAALAMNMAMEEAALVINAGGLVAGDAIADPPAVNDLNTET